MATKHKPNVATRQTSLLPLTDVTNSAAVPPFTSMHPMVEISPYTSQAAGVYCRGLRLPTHDNVHFLLSLWHTVPCTLSIHLDLREMYATSFNGSHRKSV